MGGSEIPDRPGKGGSSAESIIDRLEKAVNRLVSDYEGLRTKAADSEHSYRRLTDALKQSEYDPLDEGDLQARIQSLADEIMTVCSLALYGNKNAAGLNFLCAAMNRSDFRTIFHDDCW